MSVNVFVRFEVYDESNKVWKNAALFHVGKNGMMEESDIAGGGRNLADVIFGRNSMDEGKQFKYEDDKENLTDKQVRKCLVLERIDDIIHNAIYSKGYPDDVSKETKERVDKHAFSIDDTVSVLPDTAVYTLDDLETLEALTALSSTHTRRMFDIHFRPIMDALRIAGDSYDDWYSPRYKKNFRVIIYAS